MSDNKMAGERKIIFLVNPISGTSKKTKIVEHIKKTLTTKAIYFDIQPTNESGKYDDVAERIEKEKITDIVIVGGDGSVNNVIAALYKHEISFGIIPVGSGNGLARSAGIPMNYKKALDLVLIGNSEYIDAFLVNDQFACMLMGLGLDAQVAIDFSESKTRGLLTYVRKSINAFFKAKPYLFEVVTKEQKFSTKAYFMCVANANQFGNNFKIAPSAELNDGMLDIVIVQKMSKLRLPFAVFKQIRGSVQPNKVMKQKNAAMSVIYFQSTELQILNTSQAPIHIDGEPKSTRESMKIQVLRNCFKLIKGN